MGEGHRCWRPAEDALLQKGTAWADVTKRSEALPPQRTMDLTVDYLISQMVTDIVEIKLKLLSVKMTAILSLNCVKTSLKLDCVSERSIPVWLAYPLQ